jgi:hypothetical protein
MPDQEWTPEVLEAAVAVVRENPGVTAAEFAGKVRVKLLEAGKQAPLLPRGKSLALLRELESAGKVRREAGQALVTFWPAEEEAHAERGQPGASGPEG